MDERACSKCDARLGAAARFCPRCGTRVEDDRVRSATPVTPLLQKWRRLSRSLTRVDIRRILGEPLVIAFPRAIAADATPVEEWTYHYEVPDRKASPIRGVICFCATDGRLLSWTEPDWAELRGSKPDSADDVA